MSKSLVVTNLLSPKEEVSKDYYRDPLINEPYSDGGTAYNAGSQTGPKASIYKFNTISMPIPRSNLKVEIPAGESYEFITEDEKDIEFLMRYIQAFGDAVSYNYDSDANAYDIKYFVIVDKLGQKQSIDVTNTSGLVLTGKYNQGVSVGISNAMSEIAAKIDGLEQSSDGFYIKATPEETAFANSKYYTMSAEGSEKTFTKADSYTTGTQYYLKMTNSGEQLACKKALTTKTALTLTNSDPSIIEITSGTITLNEKNVDTVSVVNNLIFGESPDTTG